MKRPLPMEVKALAAHRRLLQQGNPTAAHNALLQALASEPNLPEVHVALARLRWPGPDFRFWLDWLHQRLQPGRYVEIGVEHGDSLALVRPHTRVTAIDPAPKGDPLQRCAGPATLHAQTSEAFFAQLSPDSDLARHGFDLAFIDGDHRFDSVLADFMALERLARPGSVIVLHDTVPLDASTASREHRTGFYTSDGWKIVPCLLGLRPDLCIVTVPTAPSGLTVVTGMDPANRCLQQRLPHILEAYRHLPCDRALASPGATFNLGVNDPAWMADWIDSAMNPALQHP